MRRALVVFLLVFTVAFTVAFTVTVGMFGPEIAKGRVRAEGVLGYAEWRCPAPAPQAWVRVDIFVTEPEWLTEAVIAHELEHVRFMSERFLNCHDFRANGRRHWMESEARAFCVTAIVAARTAGSPFWNNLPLSIRYFAGWLAAGYPFGLTVKQAEVEILRYCR